MDPSNQGPCEDEKSHHAKIPDRCPTGAEVSLISITHAKVKLMVSLKSASKSRKAEMVSIPFFHYLSHLYLESQSL